MMWSKLGDVFCVGYSPLMSITVFTLYTHCAVNSNEFPPSFEKRFAHHFKNENMPSGILETFFLID